MTICVCYIRAKASYAYYKDEETVKNQLRNPNIILTTSTTKPFPTKRDIILLQHFSYPSKPRTQANWVAYS